MSDILNRFETDFPTTFKFLKPIAASDAAGTPVGAPLAKVHLDLDAGSRFISVYCSDTDAGVALAMVIACLHWAKNNSDIDGASEAFLPSGGRFTGARLFVQKTQSGINVKAAMPGEPEYNATAAGFSGTVFVYCEIEHSQSHLEQITAVAQALALTVRLRGPAYAAERSATAPRLFICHDSRDKGDIARPLAEALTRFGVRVWYDEYSLRPGDSLRESIERGLRDCHRCVIILSQNFLSNAGWTKTEFNTIFTREVVEGRRLVLPVWCGVDKADIYPYSPTLLDVKGVHWSSADDVAIALRPVVDKES